MKNIFYFISILLLSICFNANSQESKFGRVKAGILKAIIKIDIPSVNLTGTGFIVARHNSVVKENFDYFLVTNKHMVGDWNAADKNISRYYKDLTLYFYSKEQKEGNLYKQKKFEILDNAGMISRNVKIHPNPIIDIAVLNITELMKDGDINVNSFDTSYLMGFNRINSDLELGIGNQVFAVGYPLGITSIKSNYPIAKSCYISSIIQNDFQIRFPCNDRTNKPGVAIIVGNFFLVDGLIVGGNSGSPIVIPADIYFKIENGTEVHRELENYIIGIQSSNLGGSGISVIYSAQYIKELVSTF
jgi:Trypsin-like peptidase domain